MKSEPATAKRNRGDTGPLPPLATPPSSVVELQPRRTRSWRNIVLSFVLAAVLIGGATVATTYFNNPMNDQRPVEVVKGFATAIEAKDPSKMLSYVEPTVFRREMGPEIRAYIAYIETIHFDNPRYEMLENDGEHARVRWTATARYQLRGLGSGQRPVDTTFQLTRIEGAWYLESVDLPIK